MTTYTRAAPSKKACRASVYTFFGTRGAGPSRSGRRLSSSVSTPGVIGMKWRSKRVSSSNSGVPAAAGVYVIGHSDTLHDLEISRTYVYVGETKDLHRRLDEHLPAKETNPGLREYLGDNYDDAICWFARVDPTETKVVQDDLIRRLMPVFNEVGKPPANHEDHT